MNRWIVLLFVLLLPEFSRAQPCVLSAQDVSQKMLENNMDLQLIELQNSFARLQADQSRGIYDSNLHFEANHEIDKNEPVISIFGSRTDTTNLSTTISKQFPTGTQVGAGYLTTRQSTNSPFTTFNPAYDSRWFFSLRQPLLNNAFGKSQRGDVRSAELETEAIQEQNQYLRDQIVFSAMENYWMWAASTYDQLLAQKALERAQEFLKTTQKLLKYGTTEKSDVYAAQSNVVSSEEDMIATQQHMQTFFLSLKTKMRTPNLAQCTPTQPTIPADKSLEEWIQKSLENRKDYQSLQKKLRADEYKLSSASWSRVPSFDLVSRLELNEVDADGSTSATSAFNTDHTDFFIGAQVSIPLENRFKKTLYLQSKVQKERTELEIRKLEDQIRNEVEETWQNLKTTNERIEKNKSILDLERKKLEAARKEYNIGRESSFTLLTYQQNLIQAERRLLALETSRNILIDTLQLVTGIK